MSEHHTSRTTTTRSTPTTPKEKPASSTRSQKAVAGNQLQPVSPPIEHPTNTSVGAGSWTTFAARCSLERR